MYKSLYFSLSLLLLCCVTPCLLSAQPTSKRVAILEVIDREGKFSLADKILMRGLITDAVTNTQGFEGYTRTDIDAITREHNFQRSGMVSESQIKRIGEMTGAEYVLTIEMAKSSGYVTFSSQILSVETGQIVNSGTQLGKDDISTYEESSTKIISKLLGGTTIAAPISIDEGHIWTESELKKAGFDLLSNPEHFTGEYLYPNGLKYSTINGPDGDIQIESAFEGARCVLGNAVNGKLSGIALVNTGDSSEAILSDAQGCRYIIGYFVNGRIVLPFIGVAEKPIIYSRGGLFGDYSKQIDFYEEYSNYLLLTESGVERPEYTGTLLMIFSYIPHKKDYSHGNTTYKHEYHQTSADQAVAERVYTLNSVDASYQQEHSQPV